MTVREFKIQYALGSLSTPILQRLANTNNTQKAILRILSGAIDGKTRANVAFNLNTPINILRKLSKDCKWSVRNKVAKNLNTPDDILQKLSKDSHWKVMISARNRIAEKEFVRSFRTIVKYRK